MKPERGRKERRRRSVESVTAKPPQERKEAERGKGKGVIHCSTAL